MHEPTRIYKGEYDPIVSKFEQELEKTIQVSVGEDLK